jgi:two-component system, cell cycle sensor histidine kinase and response regulator CckA
MRWAWRSIRPTDDRECGTCGHAAGLDPDQVILHAQDIRNLFTIMTGCASAMNGRAERRLPIASDFRQLTAAVNRADRIIGRMLTVDQPVRPERVPIDVGRAVADCARMLERVVGERIRLELELAMTHEPVLAEPAEIDRIVLSLAITARDAMPDGGVLTIRTEPVTQVPQGLTPPHMRARSYVRLTVSDSGAGMPADVKLRILNRLPLRTQHGAELSLAAVAHTAHALGGTLQIEGDPSLGTHIVVDLPCIEREDN